LEAELYKNAVRHRLYSSYIAKYFTKEDFESYGDFKIGGQVIRTVNYVDDVQSGCLCKQESSGRPLTAEYDERVRASFLHSPKKSTGTAAKELSMSKTIVWGVLRKRLVFSCYKCL
jgi:hypothetical protein